MQAQGKAMVTGKSSRETSGGIEPAHAAAPDIEPARDRDGTPKQRPGLESPPVLKRGPRGAGDSVPNNK